MKSRYFILCVSFLSGVVFSCGLNDSHQLGQGGSSPKSLTPRQVMWSPDRQTERQTDIQTDRQRDKQTYTNRQTKRPTSKKTDAEKWTDEERRTDRSVVVQSVLILITLNNLISFSIYFKLQGLFCTVFTRQVHKQLCYYLKILNKRQDKMQLPCFKKKCKSKGFFMFYIVLNFVF